MIRWFLQKSCWKCTPLSTDQNATISTSPVITFHHLLRILCQRIQNFPDSLGVDKISTQGAYWRVYGICQLQWWPACTLVGTGSTAKRQTVPSRSDRPCWKKANPSWHVWFERRIGNARWRGESPRYSLFRDLQDRFVSIVRRSRHTIVYVYVRTVGS